MGCSNPFLRVAQFHGVPYGALLRATETLPNKNSPYYDGAVEARKRAVAEVYAGVSIDPNDERMRGIPKAEVWAEAALDVGAMLMQHPAGSPRNEAFDKWLAHQ